MYAIHGGLQGNVLLALYKMRNLYKEKKAFYRCTRFLPIDVTYLRFFFVLIPVMNSRDLFFRCRTINHKTRFETDSSIYTIPFVQCLFRSSNALAQYTMASSKSPLNCSFSSFTSSLKPGASISTLFCGSVPSTKASTSPPPNPKAFNPLG